MNDTKTSRKRTEVTEVWTDEEKSAMQEHAKEMKAARGKTADGEADLLAKIAAMPAADRALAERIHAIVQETAPQLAPRTWYGMPAWSKDGKLLCFFQPAAKFKARYATFGFEENARLDDGNMWPTSFALTKLTAKEEERIAALVRQALG
jgi:uncharacterized protein YdhG (YjbR/CyaY superfamily)